MLHSLSFPPAILIVLHSLSDLLVVPSPEILLPFRVAMLNSSRLPLQTVLHSLLAT